MKETSLQPMATKAGLRQRLDGLERLLATTRALAAEIDLNEILKLVAQGACDALDCERASLYRYDEHREELLTLVVTELEIAEIRHGLDYGVTGHVARTRKLANVSDPKVDPRWNPSVDRATGYQTRNILAAPLCSVRDDSLLGVLQLLNKRDGSFNSFDEQLLEAFSQHAASALDRARLVEELREREATEASLKMARDVQRGFMPTELIQPDGYELASWWFPNEAVGGDYCDVVALADGRLGLVIADVSGHGLGPSLLMASVRAALRALILDHASPELLLNMLSHCMAADLQEGRFITMVMAALDTQANSLEFANAGHAPAEHYAAAADQFNPLVSTGVPLGVLDRPDYPQGPPIALEQGDLLVLGTDGIIECMDEASEQFGQTRLREIIRRGSQRPVAELVQAIGKAVEQHYVGESPPDDLTVLALRRLR